MVQLVAHPLLKPFGCGQARGEEARVGVVREVADAARRYGIELGVLSFSRRSLPVADETPPNPSGYYGNESEKLRSAIPTDPASFQDKPFQWTRPSSGFKSFTYQVDDYNRYFLNELYEC